MTKNQIQHHTSFLRSSHSTCRRNDERTPLPKGARDGAFICRPPSYPTDSGGPPRPPFFGGLCFCQVFIAIVRLFVRLLVLRPSRPRAPPGIAHLCHCACSGRRPLPDPLGGAGQAAAGSGVCPRPSGDLRNRGWSGRGCGRMVRPPHRRLHGWYPLLLSLLLLLVCLIFLVRLWPRPTALNLAGVPPFSPFPLLGRHPGGLPGV